MYRLKIVGRDRSHDRILAKDSEEVTEMDLLGRQAVLAPTGKLSSVLLPKSSQRFWRRRWLRDRTNFFSILPPLMMYRATSESGGRRRQNARFDAMEGQFNLHLAACLGFGCVVFSERPETARPPNWKQT